MINIDRNSKSFLKMYISGLAVIDRIRQSTAQDPANSLELPVRIFNWTQRALVFTITGLTYRAHRRANITSEEEGFSLIVFYCEEQLTKTLLYLSFGLPNKVVAVRKLW